MEKNRSLTKSDYDPYISFQSGDYSGFYENCLRIEKTACAIKKRVHVKAPAQVCEYEGGWYYQGNEPTCQAWAFANAVLCAGGQVSSDLLLNAVSTTFFNDGGDMNEIPKLPEANQPQGAALWKVEPLESTWGQPYAEQVKIIRRSFEKLSTLLGSGVKAAYLAAVHCDRYYEDDSMRGDIHAISICGYEVLFDGRVNIQVIDSAEGIYWISLEHFSKSTCTDDDTYVVTRRDNKGDGPLKNGLIEYP